MTAWLLGSKMQDVDLAIADVPSLQSTSAYLHTPPVSDSRSSDAALWWNLGRWDWVQLVRREVERRSGYISSPANLQS